MSQNKKIKSALISVFYKDGLAPLVKLLDQAGVSIYSTGGTFDFISSLGIKAHTVESLTNYPSILGGRVKTLHPKVLGGILGRQSLPSDIAEMEQYGIPPFDLVIVDLYPFEATVSSGASHQDIIEKIDIGGISLIRAASKNYQDVVVVPSSKHYPELINLLENSGCSTTIEDRLRFASYGFAESSHYDSAIFNYMGQLSGHQEFRYSAPSGNVLRYGENPHQKGVFFGNLHQVFEQLHGKELSYNNLLDLDAAVGLIKEFKETTFAILKHNNACGVASRPLLTDAWKAALAGDPVSAYGGVLVTNTIIDAEAAAEINLLFFEIILAPGYEKNALELLKSKKNRIILQAKSFDFQPKQFRTVLNGVLQQDKDLKTETANDLKVVTRLAPEAELIDDLLFANILVKHSKSNAIVLAKGKQLLGSGAGQTSRVDALKQAIEKANGFGLSLTGAVMASDAFFPFADSVEIAHKAGIISVIQPGGSVRDEDSIEYCNANELSMVFTGVRHFKH
ncbi:MAG: bifunctional phosphoribosylaminoimidazolecarboxamide formyltransferase/IMP cyclohydrolase [Lentimicrobiaceae bacterium]|nr:bifunctional phosphoribosylaminoimidazolecarboxamide formyltransferase/IMP cyclohydrolase [Lentimicrobiaceae bacterium]MCB9023983.1 bifunctional phosphoribosylaminoimidazolecarboxamide formyltransferase/IMP cyclohydrolase [Lentimicrobiaceae bacterium]MCO5265594.1 bifunctional phosphoribosylaminoimidazolecarboxamide formyltransferase/IMP cyclohydrolase [Lentimicrobium sp.]